LASLINISLMSVVAVGLATAQPSRPTDVPADTVISLQRTSCYGPCPVYMVKIDARGSVTYEGEKFVRVVGRQTARVDRSVVARLLTHAERIHFFDMRNAYRAIDNPDGSTTTVTDLPTKIVTITTNRRTKRVEDYVGAPDALEEFEKAIDEAAGSNRWVFTDERVQKEEPHLANGNTPPNI
jgi:uncharacterized protein DUF6438